ncbi:conserved hypothetical protein [Methylocella tundrae]|uniref:Anti-sigma factor NepR domain-containing protein n=2 Tax=Methylocella tundrae TaxID=227605 RepID=A0A4U8YZK4_METTU|nr:NepR family anti-sigma factor [Methylocella tundrae]WPP05019.1 NepR family anti-sigma factor [Methylocella tundrae]VFU07315.1 conserved protein of unknown function [Methylocella tundrae]VTZ21445.1 conserved hypothetical protein [Methylocella tundrae]VTZ51578.1 conserved hypothetical protein [Methylocella tundrae]
MSNGENRSKGDPVTKITKSRAGIMKGAAIRENDDSESEDDMFRFNHCAEGNVVSAPRSRKPSAKPDIADQIGLGLRSVYNDVLSQPVPDRFFDLLKQLERAPGAQLKKDAP